MRPIRLVLFVTLAIVATVRAASPLTTTVVLGHSMEPTMRSGGLYVLDRGYYRSHPVSPGDVVVLRHGNENYVKRVYALPGDRVPLVRYVDGSTELLDPDYAARLRRAQTFGLLRDGRLVTLKVPQGHYFVLGDNVLNSVDSRDFGPVPFSAILGRVWE
jgi:signal peptidase I